MRFHTKPWAAGLLVATTSLFFSTHAAALDPAWRAEQIADALSAAPPVVTDDAKLIAWMDDGKQVVVREGNGAYVCFASGMTSRRVRKQDLPFKDPACMDQNALAFFQAMWAEKNPMKPSKPYPKAPGIVWMLAGMAVPGGMVKMGKDQSDEHVVAKDGKKIARLTPHIMIMPLPMSNATSSLAGLFDSENPEASWIMFPETPLEHLMVHFSEQDMKSMMQPQ
jgi:hypothetical protein